MHSVGVVTGSTTAAAAMRRMLAIAEEPPREISSIGTTTAVPPPSRSATRKSPPGTRSYSRRPVSLPLDMLARNSSTSRRAGEAGRGFAVVAAEVKALATQTAGATRQISDQVTAIRTATAGAAAAVRQVARSRWSRSAPADWSGPRSR